MKHIDDWIEQVAMFGTDEEKRAAFFFHLKRLPAVMQMAFEPEIKQVRLFCTYCGNRYRVTGASRMGDVWITRDFRQERGYENRVDVEQCEDWGSAP